MEDSRDILAQYATAIARLLGFPPTGDTPRGPTVSCLFSPAFDRECVVIAVDHGNRVDLEVRAPSRQIWRWMPDPTGPAERRARREPRIHTDSGTMAEEAVPLWRAARDACVDVPEPRGDSVLVLDGMGIQMHMAWPGGEPRRCKLNASNWLGPWRQLATMTLSLASGVASQRVTRRAMHMVADYLEEFEEFEEPE